MVSWGDGWRRMLVKGPSLGVVIGDRGFGGLLRNGMTIVAHI